ncbi:ABC transporter substrate-binding protein [Siccirubricoccus sp. KC 17139]|uniref:ABC transporter substrate-binding protein n=1 Tax=Siccirubricoccus soli TaxID=2899147 RepID=A0ABT1DAD0_9PROT|nr:ABC transporter substrate-binding protein [Siccirubricoccus soli]MCO6418897.1 ABC transporter substrate-binding protein [Siccirubricoccus soli]MCP2685032.1 ABC transporter substrate-binding protein [Siccirubricoccus soli]
MIGRRGLLAAGTAAAFAAPALAQRPRLLRFVPQADLSSLDPVWTTSNVTRNMGYMVYDTLYGSDAGFRPQPQMAAGHEEAEEGRRVTITLREGLTFHDGKKVLARDAVASIRRWITRHAMGQKLAPLVEEIAALDDRRLQFRLKKPYPLLLEALGSPVAPPCFIMPERLAKTDAFTQLREVVGSGPYRFLANEFVAGSGAAFARYEGYSPTPVAATGYTAGPKVVHFDRVEWKIIPDAATAAAAMQAGEIDWFEQPPPEIQQLLRRGRNVAIEPMDPLPMMALMRFNHLQPPFDKAAIRRALLPAIDQEAFMQAAVGTDAALYQTDAGFFTPGGPMASDAGLEPLRGPRSLERAKALLKEAGYTNQPIRLMGPTDILVPAALTQVAIDLFRRLGVNLDVALTDWGTVVQRRTNKGPLDQGGWSVSMFAFSSMDFLTPATNPTLRANGAGAWFGWPDIPRLEALRDAWFEAPTLEQRQALAREMQVLAMQELPYIPVGAYRSQTAVRRDLADRVRGLAIFWNIRRV